MNNSDTIVALSFNDYARRVHCNQVSSHSCLIDLFEKLGDLDAGVLPIT